MRIASNKLIDLVDFYYSELKAVHEEKEIEALLYLSIEHFLGYSKTEMLNNLRTNINQSTLIKLYDCCRDLKQNIPLQYILKEAWFFGFKFMVNPEVLIPRPETEELVNLVLTDHKMTFAYLDIGTGSGCIPVAIKKNAINATVSACDISVAALKIAAENAARLNADVTFYEANALDEEFSKKIKGSFDVIISNPPYIKSSEKTSIAKHVLDQEPHLALFVEGNDPIIFYKKIIDYCKFALNQGGKLYFELNPLTAEDVKTYAVHSDQFKEVTLIKDMSGHVRFLKATKF